MEDNMQSKLTKLFEVAKSTKEALYAQWKENKQNCFVDYNGFEEQGLLSEAIGLTSVLLLYVRFVNDEEVFETGKNDHETINIISTSLEYIYDQVFDSGYLVTPLLSKDAAEKLFNMETAYVDTLTWVLSSSSLIIYADRENLLSLDTELVDKAMALLADSLYRLTEGQLECGAWGFSTDKNCKVSLYSTYATAVSMADFFDYILGELEYDADDENQSQNPEDFYDYNTLDKLQKIFDKNYNGVRVVDAVNESRSKLQIWLLKYCLPMLPELASCSPIDAEHRDLIGCPGVTDKSVEKDYLNLYYAYYVLDILTTSSADLRYKKIVEGKDSSVDLDDLKDVYENLLNRLDYSYFFESTKAGHAASFHREYTNLAIQSTRMNFSCAQRTGKRFWDSLEGKSELDIRWEHNIKTSTEIDEIRGNAKFKEPTLVPMALRANAVFSYYVIKRTDITVDHLFDLICNDRSSETKKRRSNSQIENLWDTQSYSLVITERSIEALVDYYDYLEKTVVDTIKANTISEESASLDDVFDRKISEFLKSENGKKVLGELGYVPQDSAQAASFNQEEISRLVESEIDKMLTAKVSEIIDARLSAYTHKNDERAALYDVLANIDNSWQYDKTIPKNKVNTSEGISFILLKLFDKLTQTHLLYKIADNNIVDDEVLAKFDSLSRQFEDLLKVMADNYDNECGRIDDIYRNQATN